MKLIDLRSDTVTRPSEGMRRAMAEAVVGDDVLGDDPTVQRLEAVVGELLGKEAVLFMPSGTMSNQVGLYTASQRGDQVLCETGAHIFNYEVAAPAVISGLLLHPIDARHGILSADDIEKHIQPINLHCPRTRIVALENTHNRAGGTIYPLETIAEIKEVARKHDLWMHLDGARLWNASAASGIALDKYASYFDAVSVCLSKGLGAPVGSLLCGSKGYITEARRTRKLFGGGMRQAGLLAAAGIYAIEHNLERLPEDHANARYLAEEMSHIDGLEIDLESVQSNIVIVDIDPDRMAVADFMERLKDRGVLCVQFGPIRVRFVTHLDVSADDCRDAVQAVREVMEN